MSKNSQDKKPYYLKYGQSVWYRDPPKFPEERDPYKDLFSDDALTGIVRSIHTSSPPNFLELQHDLRELAHCFLCIALTSPIGLMDGPSNIKRNARIRWLSAHLAKPACKLIDALSEENEHLLSDWPDSTNAQAPDKALLLEQLHRLTAKVDDTICTLDDRKTDKSTSLTEFKTDLANALTLVFKKHFSHLPSVLDSYDKTNGAESAYASFVRMCTEEIFPQDKSISNTIIDSLFRPVRRNKKSCK